MTNCYEKCKTRKPASQGAGDEGGGVMNLKFCKMCGVVINMDVYGEDSKDAYNDNFAKDSAVWNGDEYVNTIPCPVCGSKVEVE